MQEAHHRQQDQNPDMKTQPNWITRHPWLTMTGLGLLLVYALLQGVWPGKQQMYINAYVYTQSPYAETRKYNEHTDHQTISLAPKVDVAYSHGAISDKTIRLRYDLKSGVSSFALSGNYGVHGYSCSIPKQNILQWLPDVQLDQDIAVNFGFFNTGKAGNGYEGHLTLYFWEQDGQLYAKADLSVVYQQRGWHETDRYEGPLTDQRVAFGFEM